MTTHGHYNDRYRPDGVRSELKGDVSWKGRRPSEDDVKEKPSHHQGFVRHAETLASPTVPTTLGAPVSFSIGSRASAPPWQWPWSWPRR